MSTPGNTSSSSSNKVSVSILGKEYQIACPPDQEQGLLQAASNLDKQMRSIRDSGKVIGLERIAIMTALNLSHELLLIQSENSSAVQSSEEQFNRMSSKLDHALTRMRSLEL